MTNGRDIALYSARIADDKKAEDIVIYDVRGMTDVTDFFVVATAHARSQVRAIVESIKKDLKTVGVNKMGQEGNEGGSWVLIDYSDCVIHVFSPELREYYALESLWGDAPKLNWKREKFKDSTIKELFDRRKDIDQLADEPAVEESAPASTVLDAEDAELAALIEAEAKPKKAPRARKPKAVKEPAVVEEATAPEAVKEPKAPKAAKAVRKPRAVKKPDAAPAETEA